MIIIASPNNVALSAEPLNAASFKYSKLNNSEVVEFAPTRRDVQWTIPLCQAKPLRYLTVPSAMWSR
jgi:hypothetical protein